MSRDRERRHRKILEIIASRPIRTQDDLAEALAAEGWSVTQSSVSRDIAALKLAKADGTYRRPVAVSPSPDQSDERKVAEGMTGFDESGTSMLIVHTPAGEANHVAVSLDRLAWPEIAGTIAGDDTIFIACRNTKGRDSLLRRLRRFDRSRPRER